VHGDPDGWLGANRVVLPELIYAPAMPNSRIRRAFEDSVSGRRLLDHPFYKKWQQGQLSMDDLAGYAEQYRHFERCLAGVLAQVAHAMPEGAARALVEENLVDERSRPRPHTELFEGFAATVGASPVAAPSDATQNLVSTYVGAAHADAGDALAVIGVYEIQAAEISKTKGESLRSHYVMGTKGTEFWDVHAEIEADHAAWTIEALELLDADPMAVRSSATSSADAWWDFLDERELTLR
jgi:pyrroloquinoline-quinone synthase